MKHLKQQSTQKQEIDWSKPMWVQSKEYDGFIVLVDSSHSEVYFTGTCLPCQQWPDGKYSDMWVKYCFKPLTGTIMFPISNDND